MLQAAIDSGAPSDEAFALLDRLDRLEQLPAPPRVRRSPAEARRTAMPRVRDAASRTALGLAVALALLLGVVIASVYSASNWERLSTSAVPGGEQAPVAPVAHDSGLTLPRRGDIALARARSLTATGHLHDALMALDAVRATDPQKPEADRLRSDIQRQLLGLVPATGKGERRLP